jgi:hypothetical protein
LHHLHALELMLKSNAAGFSCGFLRSSSVRSTPFAAVGMRLVLSGGTLRGTCEAELVVH